MTRVKHEREWRFLGYDCLVVFHGGYRCGYVRLPYGHPWFCRKYDEVDPVAMDITDQERDMDSIGVIPLMLGAMSEGSEWLRRIEAQVEVHGGLTFSAAFDEHSGWWIGFDCWHHGDLRAPSVEAEWGWRLSQAPRDYGHYWTHREVREEVERLARQAHAATLRNVRWNGGHETEHPDEERMAYEATLRHDWQRRQGLREMMTDAVG